jgi:hypothetical protein
VLAAASSAPSWLCAYTVMVNVALACPSRRDHRDRHPTQVDQRRTRMPRIV